MVWKHAQWLFPEVTQVQEGTWGGHQELVAAARLFGAHLHIHQAGQPVWKIVPEGALPSKVRCINTPIS